MNKRKKQLVITLLLLFAGLALGFAFGILIIPYQETQTRNNEIIYNTAGNAESEVRIIEYSDYECYYCALFYKDVYEEIILPEIENNTVYYQYKDYPLETFDNNLNASFAAHCAGEQNKFWQMHDLIYKNQESWKDKENSTIVFKKFAQEIGMNIDTFEDCVSNRNPASIIQSGISDGKKLNIKTTPTVFINDQKIEGLKSANYYRDIIKNEVDKTE